MSLCTVSVYLYIFTIHVNVYSAIFKFLSYCKKKKTCYLEIISLRVSLIDLDYIHVVLSQIPSLTVSFPDPASMREWVWDKHSTRVYSQEPEEVR